MKADFILTNSYNGIFLKGNIPEERIIIELTMIPPINYSCPQKWVEVLPKDFEGEIPKKPISFECEINHLLGNNHHDLILVRINGIDLKGIPHPINLPHWIIPHKYRKEKDQI